MQLVAIVENNLAWDRCNISCLFRVYHEMEDSDGIMGVFVRLAARQKREFVHLFATLQAGNHTAADTTGGHI